MAMLSARTAPPQCEVYWDGTDFTPCFKDGYLNKVSLVIVVLSVIYVSLRLAINFFSSSPDIRVSAERLTSPIGDGNLSKLESDVILSAVASNILPPVQEKAGQKSLKPITGEEAEELIADFKAEPEVGVKRWERIGYSVGIFGASAWLGVEIARAVSYGRWWTVIFPAWVSVLSFFPGSNIIPLLSLHIVPCLLLFRSSIIQNRIVGLELAATIAELLYFFALISIPYASPLDRLMAGSKSKGGGSSGSYGSELPKHVEEPTSAFSRATYTFIIPMLVKHYWQTITLADVPALREDDASSASLGAYRAFVARRDAAWASKNLGEKRKRVLGMDLLLFFAPEVTIQCIWAIVFICLQYLSPTGLRLLLQFVTERESSDRPTHVAYLYVAMMAGGQCLAAVSMGQSLFLGRRICIRLRTIIISEVFTKALRRRDVTGITKKVKLDAKGVPIPAAGEDQGASEGKIANHVSVDAFQISEICAYIFYLVSSPFAVIVNSFLLYNTIGVSAFAGIGILVGIIPFQGLVGKLYASTQKSFMTATDVRLDSVTEIISHVKLIKFNAWEGKFFERMGVSRKHELRQLAKRFGVAVLFQLVIVITPVLVTASAFAVHVLWLKKPLTADRAFSALILFNMLRDPLALFQDTFTRLLQSWTSCNRIQQFLDEPDTLKYAQLSKPGPGDPEIGFQGAVIGYSSAEDSKEAEFEPFQLGPLNLSFPSETLSVVMGPVGCGKTTLILSLLGETILQEGKIFMPDDRANREICAIDPQTGLSDTVAYCAQTAWLIGASIRDNIVFGSLWNKERYDAVVDACALRKDFEIFELGDETEVGEKGTTCSGGQKARIALARALYSSAKTIVLDDVLSAVDAQTAKHLHVHCLLGPLMKGRTVILVTHAINLVVPSASFVVMLEDGRVAASGSPSELVSTGSLELTEEEVERSTTPSSSTLTPSSPIDNIEENLDGIEGDALDTKKRVEADTAAPEALKLAKQLVASEVQGQGKIGFDIYSLYFRSMGGFIFWVAIVTAFFGSQMLQVAGNAWMKDWTNANDPSSHQSNRKSNQYYLGVYAGISGLFVIVAALRFIIGFAGSLLASQRLYDRLLKRILGARMRFFDSTPSGRIINRLSKDMSSIDTESAEILMYFTQSCLSVAATIAVVIFSTPAFIFPFIGIAILYWLVGSLYVATSRELKRMDSTTRSPLFISFSEALVGMSTIRSYGDSARFMRKIFQELDQNTRCFWYLWQTNRVLNNFSNFAGSLVTIFACVFALNNRSMNAGAVGFSITYALSFTEVVLWVVRLYAAAEMSMNSVERVSEYLDLEVEEEDNKKGNEPPAYWPSKEGKVVVEKLTCHYAPQLDPVLREVSFEIAPQEKIGICGRTGSGKSTLALSFFRFLHQSGGSITIDGLDISKLSLSTLRSRLTILPQEAQLFSGTVRDNLDPFNQHEDMEIWEALRQCGLAGRTPFASARPSAAPSRVASRKDLKALEDQLDERDEDGGSVEVEERVTIRSLEEKVAVGGKNFSQGQRQLLALARGLLKLRSSSFLIMDESTANLDHATDQTIQKVLRTGLADIQMLVIAHRLMTVCGLDKILVLDQGKVVEFGTPWELMQADGAFRDLCRQSGEEAQLLELAKSVHEEKYGPAPKS